MYFHISISHLVLTYATEEKIMFDSYIQLKTFIINYRFDYLLTAFPTLEGVTFCLTSLIKKRELEVELLELMLQESWMNNIKLCSYAGKCNHQTVNVVI